MKSQFFFSIIIPTFNRSNSIIRTLESIKSQIFKNYEIIIVDDFSNDNTKGLVENFIKANSAVQIRYFYFDSNQGPNIAKNYGSKKAVGDYLVFLDSDDCFYDSFSLNQIKKEIKNYNNPNLIMFSSFYLHEQTNTIVKYSRLTFKEFLRLENIGEFLPVVNRVLFLKFLFFDSIRGGEGLTWLKILKKSNLIIFSDSVVRLYDNTGDDRLSNFSLNFKKRLYKINIIWLKEFWKDYLIYNPLGLIKIIIRVLYYRL